MLQGSRQTQEEERYRLSGNQVGEERHGELRYRWPRALAS